jgi:hypothetical protein
MRKIRDVLGLSAAGISKRKIRGQPRVGATAAGDCIWRARRAGLAWPLPEGLIDEMRRRSRPRPCACDLVGGDAAGVSGGVNPRKGGGESSLAVPAVDGQERLKC